MGVDKSTQGLWLNSHVQGISIVVGVTAFEEVKNESLGMWPWVNNIIWILRHTAGLETLLCTIMAWHIKLKRSSVLKKREYVTFTTDRETKMCDEKHLFWYF